MKRISFLLEYSECEEDNSSESELSDQEAKLVGTIDLSKSMRYDYLPSPLDKDLSDFIVPDDYYDYDDDYYTPKQQRKTTKNLNFKRNYSRIYKPPSPNH